jgi:ATP-dependent Clp protease ATP-binding subunit ClpA
MYEAMSDQARDVLGVAEAEAAALGARAVAPEHLLLALVQADGAAGELLHSRGVTREAVLACTVTRNGNGAAEFDPAALATLGIDLDAVLQRVEETFGPGALERTRAGRQLCRERMFTAAAKQVLDRAVNAARCELAEPEHLLLGLIEERKSGAAAVLRERGVSADAVRAAIDDRRVA